MKKGEIVLIPFPFTDLSGSKLRPVVVLFESDLDVLVCFITSKLKFNNKYDVSVPKTASNGLKVDSLLKTSKIATIDKILVVGKLGMLSASEKAASDKNLLELLDLQH